MTYQHDLAPCTYFDVSCGRAFSTRLIAVGWLHRFEPYTHGSISPAQRAKLGELLADPWTPFLFLGYHLCECGKSRPGLRNLFIPGPRGVFASPELIDHYIDVHDYRPPDEFLKALEACPSMRSPDYLAQLEAGLGEFFHDMDRNDRCYHEAHEQVKKGEPSAEVIERMLRKYGYCGEESDDDE